MSFARFDLTSLHSQRFQLEKLKGQLSNMPVEFYVVEFGFRR
jgi:hypothetical protein